MKKLLITLLLLTIVTTTFSQSKKNSPLYGTWILESAVFTTEDSVFKEDSRTKKQMKIITPGHFMFIVSSADDKFVMASGGRAIVTNDTYTEIIDYSSEPEAVNKTYKFSAKVIGDKWHQSGTVGNWKLEEVWRKAK